MKRSRTFEWEDPHTGAKEGLEMAGLDYLLAMMEGKIPPPPLITTLDLQLQKVTVGEAVFTFQPQEFHYNPIGTVHGGVISSILDSALGCTLHSTLDAGVGYTSLDLKVNFLKAVTIKSGLLSATGKLIHKGGRTALVEARLTDNEGTIYAHATSSCMIFKAAGGM